MIFRVAFHAMGSLGTWKLPNDGSVKGLVFDCDGTLIDTMSQHWAAWKTAAAEFGLGITKEQFIGYAGKPGPEITGILCQEQGIKIDEPAFMKFKRDFYEQSISKVRPIGSVLAIAQEAQKRGLPMAVASGGSREHVLGVIHANNLESMFQAYVCCEDYENSKPAPDCFLLAAQQLGVDPAACIGFEDAVMGMESIRRAGFLEAVDVTLLEGYPPVEG